MDNITDMKINRNTSPDKKGGIRLFIKKLIEQRQLVVLTVPFVIFLIVFSFIPLWGWAMAFLDYKPYLGLHGSKFVGLYNFKYLFTEPLFYQGIKNTLGISCMKLVAGFVSAITLAVLLNEVKHNFYKRTVQTISYLPHFVSWVVAANIVYVSLSPDGGIVNEVLMALHIIKEPILFMGQPKLFWGILTLSDVWKEVGWGTIIYLSAMTGIDSEQYEAAEIDGAGRIRKIFAITLPGIAPTIKLLLILSLGGLLNAGFEQVFLLQNPTVIEVSQTLEIFTYKYGLPMGRYSLATTAGIFGSVVSITLISIANRVSKMIDGESLF